MTRKILKADRRVDLYINERSIDHHEKMFRAITEKTRLTIANHNLYNTAKKTINIEVAKSLHTGLVAMRELFGKAITMNRKMAHSHAESLMYFVHPTKRKRKVKGTQLRNRTRKITII